jgi:bacteriorhodopsin
MQLIKTACSAAVDILIAFVVLFIIGLIVTFIVAALRQAHTTEYVYYITSLGFIIKTIVVIRLILKLVNKF